MKNQWYKEAVFYQIYPRSFKDSNSDGVGDIKGIISKIDYLVDLGIDAIWFSPLYQSPNADFGYDISDYKAINAEYGTMEDFDKMLELLHQNNIKVIMDLVINHTSDQHEWFQQSRDVNSKYHDYYYWREGKGKDGKKPPNNWTSFFAGSAWQYDEQVGKWYLHLFDKNQPDLNYFNPNVIKEIQDILRFWLDKGIDGFRCDVITLLSKTLGLPNGAPSPFLCGREHYIDGPRMEELLGQLQEVLREYDAFTVGESVLINVPKALRYTTEGNEYLTTVFAFDSVNADNYFGLKQLVRPFSLRKLKKSMRIWQHGLYGKSWNTLFWENHDQARIVGRYCDPVVNRVEGAKMLATILMTLSGTPFIYQGQEFGTTSIRMTNINDYQDVEAKRTYNMMKGIFGAKGAMKRTAYCSRDNARTPMQWDDSKNAGFTEADTTWLKVNPNYVDINAKQAQEDPNSVLHYYKKLIQLRKNDKSFVYGTYKDYYRNSKKIWAYLRESEYGKLFVVCNFANKDTDFTPPKQIATQNFELLTSNYDDSSPTPQKTKLRPYEAVVYKLN